MKLKLEHLPVLNVKEEHLPVLNPQLNPVLKAKLVQKLQVSTEVLNPVLKANWKHTKSFPNEWTEQLRDVKLSAPVPWVALNENPSNPNPKLEKKSPLNPKKKNVVQNLVFENPLPKVNPELKVNPSNPVLLKKSPLNPKKKNVEQFVLKNPELNDELKVNDESKVKALKVPPDSWLEQKLKALNPEQKVKDVACPSQKLGQNEVLKVKG